MIKSRSGKILLIDNDVLVYLMDNLYTADQFSFKKVVQYLTLSYGRIWISGYVKDEFLFKGNDRRRSRIIKKVFDDHSSFSDCPIKVGLNEIRLMIGMKDEDKGEADSLIQIQKAKSTTTHFFEDIVFLSNDHGALNRAKKLFITTLSYSALKSSIQETGIVLP
ncbi:MAG: hypothetical protein KF846_13770 [Cyclobacteriaceae bacterium]|nr:hypothetical protein [Cyclobacteriaceae bacterium]